MNDKDDSGYLTGNLLVAMPQMGDERFARTVVYMCAHTEDGAMGLVVNKLVDSISFPDLLDQLGIEPETPRGSEIRVHFGGPVETGRGFVLHSPEYMQDASLLIEGNENNVALTATVDILKDIAEGAGPSASILALGYAGWAPGQLDQEIANNGWLSVPADDRLLFSTPPENQWQGAMAKIGIDFSMLSGDAGHA